MASNPVTYKGIEHLVEDNYESWSLKAWGYCMGQGWTESVLEANEPTDETKKAAWKKENAKCYSFLCQIISPTQLLAYRGIYDAKKIWNSLKSRHQVTSDVKKIQFFMSLLTSSGGRLKI